MKAARRPTRSVPSRPRPSRPLPQQSPRSGRSCRGHRSRSAASNARRSRRRGSRSADAGLVVPSDGLARHLRRRLRVIGSSASARKVVISAAMPKPRIHGLWVSSRVCEIHDVEAPHPVVEAPEARAPGDDLAARGVDIEMRPVAHPDLPGRDFTAEVDRRPRRVGTGDAGDLGLACVARHHLAHRVGGRIAGQQAPARWVGEAAAAIGEAQHPARPMSARLDRQALEAAAPRRAARPGR